MQPNYLLVDVDSNLHYFVFEGFFCLFFFLEKKPFYANLVSLGRLFNHLCFIWKMGEIKVLSNTDARIKLIHV